MSSAKNTIESLRGEIEKFDTMATALENCTLYDETGHVDGNLMIDTMKLMTEFAQVSTRFNETIKTLFNITDDETE